TAGDAACRSAPHEHAGISGRIRTVAAPRRAPARRERVRCRRGARAGGARGAGGVARRALHDARPPRRQGPPALEGGARRRRAQRPPAPALHGHAGRPDRAARGARHAAPDVARPGRGPQGAGVTPATRLIRRLLPRGVRGDTMLGDLVEEWRVRGGTRRATAWYWRQALSLAVRYAWRRDPINLPDASGRRSFRMSLDTLLQD